jgi:hypothetical protein
MNMKNKSNATRVAPLVNQDGHKRVFAGTCRAVEEDEHFDVGFAGKLQRVSLIGKREVDRKKMVSIGLERRARRSEEERGPEVHEPGVASGLQSLAEGFRGITLRASIEVERSVASDEEWIVAKFLQQREGMSLYAS